jgi:tRNA(adenine34) deaminase
MLLALREAERAAGHDDVPIGAVLARDGEVLAQAGNQRELRQDPTAHAEILVLRQAASQLGGWRLPLTTLYVTLEPCAMCAGAIVLHGVGRVVFGALDPVGGAGPLLKHLPDYYAGGAGVPRWIGPVMPDVCDALFRRVLSRFDALPCGKDNFPPA